MAESTEESSAVCEPLLSDNQESEPADTLQAPSDSSQMTSRRSFEQHRRCSSHSGSVDTEETVVDQPMYELVGGELTNLDAGEGLKMFRGLPKADGDGDSAVRRRTKIHMQRPRRQLSSGTCTAAEHENQNLDEHLQHSLPAEIRHVAHKVAEQAEELVRHVWKEGWKVVSHHSLPGWLKDNELLLHGHRPQLHNFIDCFKSIFRIHTETGNIWTHMLGCVSFFVCAVYFLTRPSLEIQWKEKAVYTAFFLGAILCLGFSFLFHTVYCHSEKVGRLFNKLDYCGIALLTMGSFVPWLYYAFYCTLPSMVGYLVLILILGTICIVVSMWDAFAAPKFRPLRAGVFIGLGLSGCIPALHYVIVNGFRNAIYDAGLGWLTLMAVLYIIGAVIYAVRFPERMFPGKFDIWFQSHQIFHVFVVAAAFVHYHGINGIATYRLTYGDCIHNHSFEYVY